MFFFLLCFLFRGLCSFFCLSIDSLIGNGVHASGNLHAKGKTVGGENSRFGLSLLMTVKGTGFASIRGSDILHCHNTAFWGVTRMVGTHQSRREKSLGLGFTLHVNLFSYLDHQKDYRYCWLP